MLITTWMQQRGVSAAAPSVQAAVRVIKYAGNRPTRLTWKRSTLPADSAFASFTRPSSWVRGPTRARYSFARFAPPTGTKSRFRQSRYKIWSHPECSPGRRCAAGPREREAPRARTGHWRAGSSGSREGMRRRTWSIARLLRGDGGKQIVATRCSRAVIDGKQIVATRAILVLVVDKLVAGVWCWGWH